MINTSDDEHESIILRKPFLKLVNDILDVGKGTVTFDLDGEKHIFEFHSKPSRTSTLPLDNEGVESIRFIDSFRILSNALWRMGTLKTIKMEN